jgi:hypothetical protein
MIPIVQPAHRAYLFGVLVDRLSAGDLAEIRVHALGGSLEVDVVGSSAMTFPLEGAPPPTIESGLGLCWPEGQQVAPILMKAAATIAAGELRWVRIRRRRWSLFGWHRFTAEFVKGCVKYAGSGSSVSAAIAAASSESLRLLSAE